MKVDRIYNNNVIQVQSEQGQEIIVMGRGIGFQKKVGDAIDTSLIEKTFVLQNSTITSELSRVYADLSHEEIETVLAIIEHAQDVLETKFEIPLYISLADHLHYTFQRVKDNIVIQNPLAWEVRKIFPKEYQIARDALKIIFEKMSIPLPEDEVASIALHIINAQINVPMKEETYQVCKIISDVLGIVRLYFGNIEDEDSASYNRFVTHVRYFAQRVVNGVIQGENDLFLYEQVQLNYPKAFACSEKIKHYIEKNNHFTMSPDEQVYLTIHINRLKTASKEE